MRRRRKQFRTPVHCADLSMDDFVYVCDRPNNRLQVFTREGKFVKEAFFAKKTLGDGAVWDVAFSKDPQQKYLYIADGKNERVYILLRETLEVLSSFGDGGRQPGQFFAVHSIATDSKGNIYHDRDLRRPAGAEVRVQGRDHGAARSGGRLAGKVSDVGRARRRGVRNRRRTRHAWRRGRHGAGDRRHRQRRSRPRRRRR